MAYLCASLPSDLTKLTDEQRSEVIKLASLCRSVKAVALALSVSSVSAIDEAVDFSDLIDDMYYPVTENNTRSVGFWSVKDNSILNPVDVHEWVRDWEVNKKTGRRTQIAVPFSEWWNKHRPDYTLFGVALDRANWQKKIVDCGERECVNLGYGKPPVRLTVPKKYGDGKTANAILDFILSMVIDDPNQANAKMKRDKFVLDIGYHLLSLRDGNPFRCRKIFCFTSSNGGQGTGKSFLHESIASLVPRDAVCTVPTTYLAGTNLLPLYSSSVCILTEAPSTSADRYTAEDVKAFADAGWKTAEEKYVAKRSVNDNSLKLLSSNHLSPLPVDSPFSRRFEFYVSKEVSDGGASVRAYLDNAQFANGWTNDDLRECVGWAILERAKDMFDHKEIPFAVARRTISAVHLLSSSDYDYFVTDNGNTLPPDYSGYRDWRTDKGITWSPDEYRFKTQYEFSKAVETWIDGGAVLPPVIPPTSSNSAGVQNAVASLVPANPAPSVAQTSIAQSPTHVGRGGKIEMQYKKRARTALLANDTMTISDLYAHVQSDKDVEKNTEDVRNGKAEKIVVLRQIFPGVTFDKFTRTESVRSFNGLVHIDIDDIAKASNGTMTARQVRDTISTMDGFVIGAVSSGGEGVWAIFNAGDKVVDAFTYECAENSISSLVEERVCLPTDRNVKRPTTGRILGHDSECRMCDEAVLGKLPPPFQWKSSTFKTMNAVLKPSMQSVSEMTVDERVRNERFLEAVVDKACERIQNATEHRHDMAIRAISNILLCCRERGMAPLSSWERKVNEACLSCGLGKTEVSSIMTFWKRRM